VRNNSCMAGPNLEKIDGVCLWTISIKLLRIVNQIKSPRQQYSQSTSAGHYIHISGPFTNEMNDKMESKDFLNTSCSLLFEPRLIKAYKSDSAISAIMSYSQ
jgi:hypothetical protein